MARLGLASWPYVVLVQKLVCVCECARAHSVLVVMTFWELLFYGIRVLLIKWIILI